MSFEQQRTTALKITKATDDHRRLRGLGRKLHELPLPYGAGCRWHSDCFSCPFSDCRVDSRIYQKGK